MLKSIYKALGALLIVYSFVGVSPVWANIGCLLSITKSPSLAYMFFHSKVKRTPIDRSNFGLSIQELERSLESLSLEFRVRMAEVAMGRYTLLDERRRSARIGIDPYSELKVEMRVHELAHSILLLPLKRKIISKLEEAKGQEEIAQAVDEYYSTVTRGVDNGRGGYSFREVLNLALLVQDAFREYYSGGEDEAVFVTGSFPNGKANLKFSDVDLSFSLEFINSIAPNLPMREDGARFLIDYEDELRERVVALNQMVKNAFGSQVEPISTPKPAFENFFYWFFPNPMIIRISNLKIELMVLDYSATSGPKQFLIPLD